MRFSIIVGPPVALDKVFRLLGAEQDESGLFADAIVFIRVSTGMAVVVLVRELPAIGLCRFDLALAVLNAHQATLVARQAVRNVLQLIAFAQQDFPPACVNCDAGLDFDDKLAAMFLQIRLQSTGDAPAV